MSGLLVDYHISLKLHMKDIPFYALIMAAMRKADSDNIEKLKQAFPDIWAELQKRYNAPGGIIKSDKIEIPIEEVLENIESTCKQYE